MTKMLPLLYFVSGAAALVYEVGWNRMFVSTLGGSSYTLAVILAAYMAGLALGSVLFGGRADRSRSPLRLYAWLEIGIALWAVFVPQLLTVVQNIHRTLYEPLANHMLLLLTLRLLLGFLILLVPTTLMGGTYPALGRALATSGTIGKQAAVLYAANTLGAMFGAAWAGFSGIASLGVRGTTQAAALGSLAAGLAALLLQSRLSHPTSVSGPRDSKRDPAVIRPLLIVCISGLATLALEVVWTRLVVAVIASTTYAFSAMLVVFLAGIAVGSAAAAPFVSRVSNPIRILGWLSAAVGLSAVSSIVLLGQFSAPTGVLGSALGAVGWGEYLGRLLWDVFRLAFPATFFSGAMIPFAAEVLSRDGAPPARALARVYAWNTVGAMIGAPLAAFVLVPVIGRFGWVILVCGLCATVASSLAGHRLLPLASSVVVMAAPFATDLSVPLAVRHHLYSGGHLRYYREGATCTVAVVEGPEAGRMRLFTDSFEMAGAGSAYRYMRVLAHLPMLLAPSSRSAAVIGFGTGTSVATLALHPLDQIDIVEISSDVTDASGELQAANHGILLHPPRKPAIRLIFEDGKTYLESTAMRYDVIVSEPPLPCLAGTSNLFSEEFYRSVARCLRPGGVYVQWLPIHGMSPRDCPGLVRSFLNVFPRGLASLYRDTVFLVAASAAIDRGSISVACADPRVQRDLDDLGFARPEDVVGSFMMTSGDLDRYAGDAPPVTDDRPWVEFFDPERRMLRAPEENMMALMRSTTLEELTVKGAPLEWATRCRRSAFLAQETQFGYHVAQALHGADRHLLMDRCVQSAEEALRLDAGNRFALELLAGIRSDMDDRIPSDLR